MHQHPYWINVTTGESSWENPNETTTSIGEIEGYEYTEEEETINNNDNNTDSVIDETWERHYDEASDWYYYYNPVTGETKWDNITEEYSGDGTYQTIDGNYYDENYTNYPDNTENNNLNLNEEEGGGGGETLSNTQAGVARAWLKEARKLQAIGAK